MSRASRVSFIDERRVESVRMNDAEDYLSKNNISELLQWLTTEMVMHKPEHPLYFINALAELELAKDPSDWNGSKIEQMIELTNSKSPEEIERVMIKSRDIKEKCQRTKRIRVTAERFHKCLLAAMDLKKETLHLPKTLVEILQCDGGALWIFHSQPNDDTSKLELHGTEFKDGIDQVDAAKEWKAAALNACQTGKEEMDKLTQEQGYLLTIPLQVDSDQVGVLQAFQTDPFELEAKDNFQLFAAYAAQIILTKATNQTLSNHKRQSNACYEFLENIRTFNKTSWTFLEYFLSGIKMIIACQGTIFFTSEQGDFWSTKRGVNTRYQENEGPKTNAVLKKQCIVSSSKDGHCDCLCVPMFDMDNNVIAVIELSYEDNRKSFKDLDVNILKTICNSIIVIPKVIKARDKLAEK